MSEAAEKAKSSLDRFAEAVDSHVPPEADSVMDDTVTLRQGVRYRVRFRAHDLQFETVCRFDGFDVPGSDDPSVLILEFVPEFSYEGPDAEGA